MGTNEITILISVISLIISICAIFFSVLKWIVDWKREREYKRLDLIRDLYNKLSDDNWSSINSINIPGVFPPMSELKLGVEEKNAESLKAALIKRTIAIEHLNLLMKVYSHLRILKNTDIEGFRHWANNWYDDFREELIVILHHGGLYPIEFIIWLRDDVFRSTDFSKLVGRIAQERIKSFKKVQS